MKNSVLLIGIDGATWDLLKPWIENGELPTLKKLLNKGAEGYLKTTIPTISCVAWTSLFTGTNPGKHGIFDYLTNSGRLVNSDTIKSKKIWQVLSDYSKRCCAINVPMTYPVERINGYMVSGVLTPPDENIYSYPHELMAILRKHDYKIVKHEKADFTCGQKTLSKEEERFLNKLYGILKNRYSTLKELMNEPWDFFMIVFDEAASTQMYFWDKKEVILEFFKKVDFYIGDLIKTFSAKNENPHIFIVSDHGCNAAPTRSLNFRAWLNEEGFIRDERSFFQKTIPKIYRALKFHRILNKPPISKLLVRFSNVKEIRESFQRKVTESPTIYCRKGLFIDQSKLRYDEYDKLRDRLIAKIRQIKDPLNNEAVFQVVEKREDIYSGNSLKDAPDIVLLPKENYSFDFSYNSTKVFDDIKLPTPGRHNSALYGIFLAYGNEINNAHLKNLSILDLFPTILHILDIPIPQAVDGKVLKEVFKKDSQLYSKEIAFSKESRINLEEKNSIRDVLQDIEV